MWSFRPLVSLPVMPAVDTSATAISAISFKSNIMLWSGGDPKKGLAVSLSPFERVSAWGEIRWTILSVTVVSVGSSVEEEKMPLNCSPCLVVTMAVAP